MLRNGHLRGRREFHEFLAYRRECGVASLVSFGDDHAIGHRHLLYCLRAGFELVERMISVDAVILSGSISR